MKDHHPHGGNGIKRAVRSAPADNGKLPHQTYNNDIKRFQARKYSNEIKKKELEKKVHEKSSMLRKYAKLCAREGIVSDRVHIGSRSDDVNGDTNTTASNGRGNSSTGGPGSSSSSSRSDHKKNQPQRPKPNHFTKRIQKQAQQLLKEKEEKEQQFQEKLQHKDEAMKVRLKKHKAITQKTTRGQPVLNNQIKLLLEKLKK